MSKTFVKKEITKEVIATFLNGRDEQRGIVNLDYKYQNDFITVYYRNENDERCVSQEPFVPFLWATEKACLRLCNGDKRRVKELLKQYRIWVKPLDVTNSEGEVVEEIKKYGYTYLFYATTPMSYSKFLEFFKKAGNPVSSRKKKDDKGGTQQKEEKQYLAVTPKEQFMISTGKRFFKGYEDYNDILRLIFDLETTGLNTEKDKIEQFGIRFNRPVKYKGEYIDFQKIFITEGETEDEKGASELQNIITFLKIIYTFRPDVITAHNGEAFDWQIIIGACKRLGTTLEEISAKFFNGESIYKDERETILKLGGEIEKYHRTVVPTTIVTDSLHAVRRAQALDSNMLFSNLKYVSRYSDLIKENRVYMPGDKISVVWNDFEHQFAFNETTGDWYIYDENHVCESEEALYKTGKEKDKSTFTLYTKNKLLDGYKLVDGRYIGQRYLLDDLWECDMVEHRYNTPNFLICKMIPVPFDKCCTMGTAGQWKSIMLAWSYENDLAIPQFSERKTFTGGLSRLLKVGFVDNVAKFDYNSLYPSIILTWGITDAKDLLHSMLYFLEHVLTEREKYKGLKKKAGKAKDKYKEELENCTDVHEKDEINRKLMDAAQEESANDKKQLPLKIFGNSFFGSYGAPNVFPWASIACAERTTCTGRMALRLMIFKFTKLGYQPIVGDTDGFNFQLPSEDKFRYTKEHPYISPGLSRETKEGAEYVGFRADVAEFNDLYMKDFHYGPNCVNKMGLGIDEVVSATINFSRKNYADYFPEEEFPKDVKMVGNTIKSKKMPEYISKFLEKGIRLLLRKKGQEFIEAYYDYIEKIYNYQIPLKMIASKGKIKKTLEEYVEDCKTITKAGRPKSRQAWMELALRENLNVNMGETIYYINIGKTKSQTDAKKVTHYYVTDGLFGDKTDHRVALEKEWKKDAVDGKLATKEKALSLQDYVKKHHPDVSIEEEVVLNCKLVPREVVDSEEDIMCKEGEEYNVQKYIDQFNKRITPLLVCFRPEIRNQILITNPDDRQYFTYDQCELCNGFPNKESDQDTYEQLMTLDDREIKFWMSHPEWKPPYLEYCEMDWDEIQRDYLERMEKERQLGIDKVKARFAEIVFNMTLDELEDFEDGDMPKAMLEIVDVDPITGKFMSKEYKDIVIGTILDVLEAKEDKINALEFENEIETEQVEQVA